MGKVTDEIMTESVETSGSLAVERGRYVMTFTPGPGAPPGAAAWAGTGKFVQHWRRVDGRWQMATSIWNSNRPLQ